MRENQEQILALKQMSPDGKLPTNAILEYKPAIDFPS